MARRKRKIITQEDLVQNILEIMTKEYGDPDIGFAEDIAEIIIHWADQYTFPMSRDELRAIVKDIYTQYEE